MFKYCIYVILVVSNIIYGVILATKKKDYTLSLGSFSISVENILATFLMIDLAYIAIVSRNIADLDVYKPLYDSGSSLMEPGYVFLSKHALSFGIDFFLYRTIMLIICYALMWWCLKKINIGINICLSLYAIYPFTIDVIQYRNLIALSIVFCATVVLFDDKKFSTIRFVLIVLCASLVHRSAVTFLILILAKPGRNQRMRRKVLVFIFSFALLFSALMKITPGVTQVLIRMLMSIDSERTVAYTKLSINWGFLLYWTMELLYLFSALINRKQYLKVEKCQEQNRNLAEFIYRLNICCSCLLPLLMINITFYRLYSNISIWNYMQLPLLLYSDKGNKRTIGIFVFCVAFALNVMQNMAYNTDYLYFPIFA
ncbi:hypothetical protein BO223_10925 [Faecalibaculum rodentium]|uniref:EpsG family protein n=1 Tax=Faecalibaculum rodentium TaxID=1702221 RepID=A0A1Q9YHS9_9FIRM|nr:hypothetical protein BO223_10925 [Faecalibaculum rodentium]